MNGTSSLIKITSTEHLTSQPLLGFVVVVQPFVLKKGSLADVAITMTTKSFFLNYCRHFAAVTLIT